MALKEPLSDDFVKARPGTQHESSVTSALRVDETATSASLEVSPHLEDTNELCDQYFNFVWRSLRRLGVAVSDLEDACQDVLVIVHRRMRTYEYRSSVKSWIFGIAVNVARNYGRRRAAAKTRFANDETVLVCSRGTPEEARTRIEAAEQVQRLLEGLDEDKRAVLVMAELEQMQAPEIAEALRIPLNTVYSRLRLARAAFEDELKRLKARDEWRYR